MDFHKYTAEAGMDNPVYDENINIVTPIATNNSHDIDERTLQTPLYSDIGPTSMNTTNKLTHNTTFEQLGYTDSAVPSETTYEIPCSHVPIHVLVNNGMRQASVGMDSSEAVYDMPQALDDMNDDDDNCYSVVGPTDSSQPNLQHERQHLTVSCDDSSDYSHLQHK